MFTSNVVPPDPSVDNEVVHRQRFAEALFLATHLIVMSPRPGRIVHRYELGFSRQYIACRDARKVKSDPEFIRLREEVLSVIQQRHERAA